MRQNKRVIETAAVLVTAVALSVTAFASPQLETAPQELAVVESGFGVKSVAGVAGAFEAAELVAYNDLLEQVTVEKAEVEVVTAEAPQVDPEELEWADKAMTTADSLNVRAEANGEAEIVGKLRTGDLAVVVEKGSEWTLISSGNVNGYVSNEYMIYANDALSYAKENIPVTAKSTADRLRVRAEASTDAKVVKVIDEGDTLTVDQSAAEIDGWVAVIYNDTTCYVYSEFVTTGRNMSVGITVQEEAEAAEAARQAEEAAKRQQEITYGAALAAEVDDVYLLACLIQCECGDCSYECQLAAAAVVCNRVKGIGYPNSLYEVIYQPYQFGPARNGSLARRLERGPSDVALAAAQAALSGVDNTGGLYHFNDYYGQDGIVIDSMVFY